MPRSQTSNGSPRHSANKPARIVAKDHIFIEAVHDSICTETIRDDKKVTIQVGFALLPPLRVAPSLR